MGWGAVFLAVIAAIAIGASNFNTQKASEFQLVASLCLGGSAVDCNKLPEYGVDKEAYKEKSKDKQPNAYRMAVDQAAIEFINDNALFAEAVTKLTLEHVGNKSVKKAKDIIKEAAK